MIRTHYSADIEKKEGQEVKVAGFVINVRDMGKIKFLILRDRKGELQLTIKDQELGKLANSFNKESFITASGKVKISDKAPGGIEILPDSLEIISQADSPLPIDITGKIDSNLDKRLDWRFLDIRNSKNMQIFLLQSEIVKYIEQFMHDNDFVRIFSSRLTSAATEGGTEYFPIIYFEKEAFLAQSPQIYKEAALLSGLDKVYDIGFVYRAEPHHTPRHLCEYTSFDLEMVCESLDEILDIEESLVKFVLSKINENCQQILENYEEEINIPEKIPRLSFDEVNKILHKLGVAIETNDLTPEGERAICEYCKAQHNSEFVFVTEFPFEKKPFYTMKSEKGKSLSFDLLFRGLEITSGGIREHRYEKRSENIIEKGMKPEGYDHLRFWKFGMPPHGGFAIGIERFTMQILGLKNVREATFLPRDPTRLVP